MTAAPQLHPPPPGDRGKPAHPPSARGAAGEPKHPTTGDPALLEDPAAVEEALRDAEAGRSAAATARRRPKLWLAVYVVLFAILAWAYPLVGTGLLHLPPQYAGPARRFAVVLLLAVSIRAIVTLAEVTLTARVRDAADRYDLIKVMNLAGWLLVALVAATQLFESWYTAAASLGLVSLVLGLALQAPLTSFFAWIYILARQPYRVGDRIKIGDASGDVIQVSYLDTTLWEFGGPYLSTDHPSGRIIKFPNASVLTSPVYNYTWPLFPYRWDEIKFNVAYESDLDFVARTMQETVQEQIGQEMMQRIGAYRRLLAQTPVDELTVQERPTVVFRVSENTWLEAIVRYIVDPRQAGRVKTRLIPILLKRLTAEPDKVLFPKSNLR